MTAGAVILASALVPTAANALDAAEPTDPSVAQGQIIQLPADLLGGLDIAALGHTITSNPAAPGSELGGLDVGLLDALNIDVGTLNIALLTDGTTPGLLQLGDLGATQSFSSSPSQTQSIASSGVITSGGAIDTGSIDGSTNPASLELTGLLDQLGLTGVTDGIIDEASIAIGALASRAESTTGTVDSEYRVAGLNVDLHSQLLDDLADTLGTTVQGALTPVSNLVGPGGALTGLLGTVTSTLEALNLSALGIPLISVDATDSDVSIAGLDTVGATVVAEVLTEPVENTTGSVLVNLATGTISVDLAQILVETGAGADLNSLPANTPVLSAATISAIQQGVTSALTGTHTNSLNGKLSTVLTTTLDALQVTLNVDVDLNAVLLGTVASGGVTVQGTLAQFAGTDPAPPTVTSDLVLAGLDLGTILTPVLGAVTGAIATTTGPLVDTALTSVVPGLQTTLAGLTGPLLTALDPVLQGVLSGVATITINEQSEPGDIPGDSFTVRALGIDLLPAVGGGVELDLASSTVKAAAAAVAAIDAADTVQAGTNLPVTGSGWPANTDVEVEVTTAGGTAVNDPVTVTTDASGAFTGSVFIPAATAPGAGYIVTATDGTSTATDTTEVTAAAAIDAAPAVQAGTDLGVSGTNWPANTQVSVQLAAPGGGANIGGPELVTTDGSGSFTLDYPVPAGTPAATGYTVTATVGTQTATDTTEVTDAPVATIDAAATVQAGTNLAVSGTTWPANTPVSVQLTAPGGGANVGGPETVTTDGAGGFTLNYPVPASAAPGTAYTVTATAGAVTAIDTTEVTAAAAIDAADTVQAGTSLPITGSNWPANTQVSVTLTPPGGGVPFDPETVTTDGAGGFTLNYPVPAAAVPGAGYTVTATVGTQTATDTTEVTAAAAIDAAATVQAGTSLPVTGTGWPANTLVSVQLTAPGGGVDVGGPETVTTDGSGGFTLDYPVPADATPGTGYTVTATVGTQTATDTTAVTAAATVDAADTVEAGSDLAVSGTDWPADTQVTIQLTAPGGAVIGTPQVVTTGALGGFAIDYPVPAGTPAGTGYTVTASVGTQIATDTTEVTAAPVVVDAAATVPAGTNLSVTGTGWPVNSTVSLQLTAPGGGADVGGPVTTSTDEFGAFTANYPVPADTVPGTGYTLTATSGAFSDTDTTEVTAGDPGDVNTNAAASASASADATADGDPSAQAAAEAAALSDATSTASAAATADAESAAEAAATTDASTTASTDVTSTANASAAVAAQAAAQADASDDVNADASTAADSNSAASSESAATADSSTDASSEASANTNAAASASASADATADGDPSAQAAAEAAAFSDATAIASAAADASAESAAEAAALTAASTDASTTSTSTANASAAVAAQAAAQADASDDVNADASTAADANSAASSESAATADSSTDASSEASANTNAAASASASANADASTDAIAEAAAQAAAFADATAEGSAAADPAAEAAAESAATATSSTAATADATSEANAGAAIAAQAAALADASTDTAAEASATSDASTSAASNASAAAIASASTDASSDAVATADASAAADPSAEVNTNASASASASAQADDDSNASVEAAAVAAALADATSTASAAADVTADAAASAAATDDASTDASTTATTDANASAAVAAQAAAQTDATSTSAADASASADADPNASAAAAANASSSATASASAAADASAEATAEASASATAEASASADAAADPTGRIAIAIKTPVLERGAQQTAVGTGFAPGESVSGVMTSAPIALGTQVANAQGTVTFTWTVPSSTDLGTHTVTLTGASSGSVAATFQVVASGLATTGGEIQGGWIALAALLLMLGLGVTRIARSRRPMVQAE
ncbi:choice-of-anchor G family protein [Microbacterium sp. WCS2018Hpa-23]|uniref:choice-of-anchor G family protein n=1 Tax=Microbacterium sp. WCS2018Hpa-23 TaxID=3073634 RepID=UPI0028831588|nr:choice-of-anchor G family protein [Microbacterium sp. WCS2018Hpa-23]